MVDSKVIGLKININIIITIALINMVEERYNELTQELFTDVKELLRTVEIK